MPCLNEAETLPRTLAEIPREIPGIDLVEVLVVDDGSNDDTARVALGNGADHVVRHSGSRSLQPWDRGLKELSKTNGRCI